MTTVATLRRLITRALEGATPSMEHLAKRLGFSSSALRRIRLGNRRPSAALVRGLARLLRAQAQRLERLAAELERAITKKGGTGG